VTEAPQATGPREALRLVRTRNFGPYFAGNAISASGTWFQNLAAAILVYRLTHSAFLLGVLNFSNFIAVLVLAPWAGAAADRLDQRRLLVVTQLASTAMSGALTVLAFTHHATAWVVIVFALGLGVASAFAAPASQALIGWLVPPRDLPSAVGLNSMTYNVARAVGPALAAVFVRHLGIAASFAINSASYLALVAALAVVEPRQRTVSSQKARLGDSIRLVRSNTRLLVFLCIVASVGFASDPVNTLAPALAHAFGRPDTASGYIIGAFGAGAVLAALLLAGRVTGTRRRMVTTLLLLAGGMIAFGLVPWLAVAFPLLLVAGFAYHTSNTHATPRLQLEVEEHQRGRIMALWSVAFLGLRPVASLVDGAIASLAGVRVSCVVLTFPALACAAWVIARGRAAASASAEAEARA
jgi:MFS family permease